MIVTFFNENRTSFFVFDQRLLFFIIGVGRSGTTLLQEIMNTFDGFNNLKESIIGDFPNGISCWSDVRNKNDFTRLENFIQENWNSKFFVEKQPGSIYCLPQLLEKFPNANYLFLERNPLKIVLSHLNMFDTQTLFELRKQQDAKNLDMAEYCNLNPQQYSAKRVYVGVSSQVPYKNKFLNRIVIRYEELINSPKLTIDKISNLFNIEPNYDKMYECLKRPSFSSKNNRYNITKLTDEYAIELTKTACQLWKYPFIN